MLVHTALTTHKEPKNLLVITDDKVSFQTELDRYKFLKLEVRIVESSKLLSTLQNEKDGSLDVVIIGCEIENDKTVFAHVNRILTNEGLTSLKGDFTRLEILASEFRIAMPYLVNSLEKSATILLFGTKFYHPTADINLQRADFLDGCSYYNSDIQNASFVMPNFIKSEIKEFVKN